MLEFNDMHLLKCLYIWQYHNCLKVAQQWDFACAAMPQKVVQNISTNTWHRISLKNECSDEVLGNTIHEFLCEEKRGRDMSTRGRLYNSACPCAVLVEEPFKICRECHDTYRQRMPCLMLSTYIYNIHSQIWLTCLQQFNVKSASCCDAVDKNDLFLSMCQ